MHVIDGAPRCIDGGMNADRCVYAKFRETGEPFYIGKGSQKRAWDHEQEARRGKRSHKCHIIRDMWSRGHEPITVMLHEGLTETTANEYEMAFIRAIGRADLGLGPLANLTDGGDGTTGHKPSPEVIAKLVARLRGKKLPPDSDARCRLWLSGRRRRRIAARSGRPRPVAEYRPRFSGEAFRRKHSRNGMLGSTRRRQSLSSARCATRPKRARRCRRPGAVRRSRRSIARILRRRCETKNTRRNT